jgi:branched-chain amino acid transport system ATP-binding protein
MHTETTSGAKTAATAEAPLLKLSHVTVHYRVVRAIHDISFDVAAGQIVTLIGSNGAGKTTTLKTISGLLKPTTGEIVYRGEVISRLQSHEIVKRRLCQAPEGRGIFLNLTVEDNLDLGAWTAPNKATLKDDMDYVFQMFPRLKERRKQNAGTLSGGEQQMLAIGRALMSHPEMLLLDEPSLGLAPQIIEKIFEIIQKLNKDGKTILLVEQNALQALEIAHYGLVLETGKIVLQGPAKQLLAMDEVRKAYLGA